MTAVSIDPLILARIPHRPPFLWIDRVIELSDDQIRAEKLVPDDLPLFQGHYPAYPIMPGVLLCEAIFQAGALLISEIQHKCAEQSATQDGGVPVLTRILGAKFKREVHPGDTLEIVAKLVERLGPAWIMKGSVRVQGKVAVQVEFACARKEG